MKGTLYANPTFIKKGIHNPKIILTKPLVAYNEHRLYFNHISIKFDCEFIVNCTYSEEYKVLLILTDDYKIHVFTENLELICLLNNWEPKYIVGFQLIESLSMLILIGTEQIEIMKIELITNVKKTKFMSSMKFGIKNIKKIEVDADSRLKWNKGYTYSLPHNILLVWSLQDIYFYSISNLAVQSKIMNLSKKQNSISITYFNSYYKYTVTGLINGEIKVWRLPISTLFHHKEMLIHTFHHQSKQILEIIEGDNYKTIISSSADLILAIMSLDTFQILRTFNFVGEYTKIYLMTEVFAYAIKDQYLGQLNFGRKFEFIAEMNGNAIMHQSYQSTPNMQYEWSVLTFSNNIGLQLDLNQFGTLKQFNKTDIRYVYPPLKSKNITHIISNHPEKVWMMVEGGNLFQVKMYQNSGKIERYYQLEKVHDSQNHKINENGVLIKFINFIPPPIDTQINDKSSIKREMTPKQSNELLMIGCSRGSILFLNISNMERVYARFSFHRQSIVNVQELYHQTYKQYFLVSVCREKLLKIINIEDSKATCTSTIFLGEVYLNMESFEDNLILVFKKGLFQICSFQNDSDELSLTPNMQAINHDDEILSLDFRRKEKLILTSGRDNRIKIWTTFKILVYEIITGEQLNYCVWLQNHDLLIIQNQKMYCLKDIPLKYSESERKSWDQDFIQNFQDEKIKLDAFVGQMNSSLKKKMSQVSNRDERQKREHLLNLSVQMPKIKSSFQQVSSPKTITLNSRVIDQSSKKRKRYKNYKTEQNEQDKMKQVNDLQAIKKHLEQISSLKRVTNQSLLPKIKIKNTDIFADFMKQKLVNKRLLTRRDITLNRIIMKNIIKDHFDPEGELIKNFRVE